ncbi:MAG: aquaporin [Saprospiraceae bacterium]|nr:aquaporin [Saprospiraceae bacterium]
MQKYLNEFLGTFFLVLIMLLAHNNAGIAPMAPLVTGGVLMALTYAGWHISGAHFNPAVTIAVMMRGKIDRNDAIYYIIAQMAAGLLAALIGVFLHHCQSGAEISLHSNDAICSVTGEFLGAFALVWVFLNVLTAKNNSGQAFYGLAIGFVYMACSYALGSLSGGAFNPALAFGFSIAGMATWSDIWIYFLGALLGAAAATTVFQIIYGRGE